MELELKHIQHYELSGDNGLKFKHENNTEPIQLDSILLKCEWNFTFTDNKGNADVGLFSQIKPLLLPMSSLYTEITHNGKTFIPLKELDWRSWNDEIGYIVSAEYGENPRVAINVLDFIDDYYKLLEWHFDVFGLIDKGLALDKTKIK